MSARPYLAFSAASLTAVWAFSEVYVPMRQRAVVQKAALPADLEGVMTVETFERVGGASTTGLFCFSTRCACWCFPPICCCGECCRRRLLTGDAFPLGLGPRGTNGDT